MVTFWITAMQIVLRFPVTTNSGALWSLLPLSKVENRWNELKLSVRRWLVVKGLDQAPLHVLVAIQILKVGSIVVLAA